MINSFNISLIISGTINEVKKLDILKKYGRVIFCQKGTHISRLASPLEQDFFKFTYTFKENYERDLKKFVNAIKSVDLREYKNCDLKLRIYIQSFDAQIILLLSKNMIDVLHNLGLDVEISILSWGEVKDD